MKLRTIILGLTASAIVSATGLARNIAVPGDPEAARVIVSPAVVRIEHNWLAKTDDELTREEGDSLGTFISPNVILTHNHFAEALGSLPYETLTFTYWDGETDTYLVSQLGFAALDDGTLLICLPREVSRPSATTSPASTVAGLASGDWLAVDFWDDTAGGFAQQDVQVVKVDQGVATVADPQGLINPGDSGGGVYFNGQLIGNNWSVNTADGSFLGTFNVALLPMEIADMMRAAESAAPYDNSQNVPEVE